jgi:hypothetical protein
MRHSILFSLMVVPLFASAHGHEHGDNLAAHVHGAAVVQLAIDGQRIELAMTVPMIDIAGFEGEADTAERREQARAGLRQLETVVQAVRFDGASDCKVDSATAMVKSHQHGDHDHDHDHEHDHDHDHEHEHEHGDVELSARWTCASAAVTALNIDPWSSFQSLESIRFEWVDADGQGSATLTKPATSIGL